LAFIDVYFISVWTGYCQMVVDIAAGRWTLRRNRSAGSCHRRRSNSASFVSPVVRGGSEGPSDGSIPCASGRRRRAEIRARRLEDRRWPWRFASVWALDGEVESRPFHDQRLAGFDVPGRRGFGVEGRASRGLVGESLASPSAKVAKPGMRPDDPWARFFFRRSGGDERGEVIGAGAFLQPGQRGQRVVWIGLPSPSGARSGLLHGYRCHRDGSGTRCPWI